MRIGTVGGGTLGVDAGGCREMARMAESDPAGLARLLEDLAGRLGVADTEPPEGPWRADGPRGGGAFAVRREYGCVNGLSAWFAPIEVAVDDGCVLMTDGAIDDAATLAAKVARALNLVEAMGVAATPGPGGLGRIA